MITNGTLSWLLVPCLLFPCSGDSRGPFGLVARELPHTRGVGLERHYRHRHHCYPMDRVTQIRRARCCSRRLVVPPIRRRRRHHYFGRVRQIRPHCDRAKQNRLRLVWVLAICHYYYYRLPVHLVAYNDHCHYHHRRIPLVRQIRRRRAHSYGAPPADRVRVGGGGAAPPPISATAVGRYHSARDDRRRVFLQDQQHHHRCCC